MPSFALALPLEKHFALGGDGCQRHFQKMMNAMTAVIASKYGNYSAIENVFSSCEAKKPSKEEFENCKNMIRDGKLIFDRVESNLKNKTQDHRFDVAFDNTDISYRVSSRYILNSELISGMNAHSNATYFYVVEDYDEETPERNLLSIYRSNTALESFFGGGFSDAENVIMCPSIEGLLIELALHLPYGICFVDWRIEGFVILSVLARDGRLHEAPPEFLAENAQCLQNLDTVDYFGDTPLHLAARTGTLGLLPRELITARRLLSLGRFADFPVARPIEPALTTLLAVSLKAGEADWLLPHLKTISASDWSDAEAESGIKMEAVLASALSTDGGR